MTREQYQKELKNKNNKKDRLILLQALEVLSSYCSKMLCENCAIEDYCNLQTNAWDPSNGMHGWIKDKIEQLKNNK